MIVVGLSLGACALIYLAAPYLPLVFGTQYTDVEGIARWLSLLPLTTASWFAVRSIASTTGQERLAAAVESGGAFLNIALCLVLIGTFDWRGAILATYLTHLGMTSVALLAMKRTTSHRATDT